MNQNKGYLKGLATGVLVTAIAFSLIFAFRIADINSGTSLDQSSSISSNGTNIADDNTVMTKIGVISKLIDTYSLNTVDESYLVEGMFRGIVGGLGDVYSTYFTKEEYAAMMESTSGKYYGIGVLISQDPETGIISVVKPFPNGPGYEAGILPGDILYSVDGVEVTGIDSSKVVSWIKGIEGSTVKIKVARDGESDYLEFEVERRQIEVPTVEYRMLEDKVGYIIVSEFDEVTADQFIAAIDDLNGQGMKGLVIDLRGNPGGLFSIVVEMLDYILPEGLIVYTEDRNGDGERMYSDDKNKLEIPYSVIINGSSASASEIFAGAVKDFGIGTVVGTTSYGKGVVQRIFPLTDGSAVKLTISKYFTAKGNEIDQVGIEPDVIVELPEELRNQVVIEESKDTQLQKAIEVLELK